MVKAQKRTLLALMIVAVVLISALMLYHFVLRGNSDALWQIVSQKCLPTHSTYPSPNACLKVDEKQHYVVFKDARGPLHDLVMPTFPITGLESSILVSAETPLFMASAWAERSRLAKEAGFPIPDNDLSLAINSRLGRSQDHLHIHIACLQPSAKESLARQAAGISSRWSRLPEPIMGRDYFARRITEETLNGQNTFVMLDELVRAEGLAPGSLGLGLALLADGDFVLLATGRDLLAFDLGSIGKMQDFTCAVASKPDGLPKGQRTPGSGVDPR